MIIGLTPVSNDAAEMKVLECAKAQQLMIPIGLNMNVPAEQAAFLKSRDLRWIELLDIVVMPLPNGAQTPARFFVLTVQGQARLDEIKNKAKIDKRLAT